VNRGLAAADAGKFVEKSVFDITKPHAESKFNFLNCQNKILLKMRDIK
jgi:hypothetical protein